MVGVSTGVAVGTLNAARHFHFAAPRLLDQLSVCELRLHERIHGRLASASASGSLASSTKLAPL